MSRFSVSIRRDRRDRISDYTRDFYEGLKDYVIPHPYNREFIAQFSRRGIIIRQFPRNMNERIRKTNGFRTGCARPSCIFLLRLETKRPTIAEVVSREYTRATLAQSGYQFSFTAPFARVQLSSFFRSPQLPRSHRLYRRSRHSPLRNGVLIRRLVAGNNNLRHTSFVSINLSKRRGIHSRNSFS